MTFLRTAVCIAAYLLLSWTASSQEQLQLSDWQTYSSMRTVRSAAIDASARIWCATAGGVFVHDPSMQTTTEFRNVDALSSLDATAIAADPTTGRVFVGAFDGSLDIVGTDGHWRNVLDIRRATQYQRRRVNDLVVNGTTLFVATDFGIVTYDIERNVFLETIDRIGPLQEKTPVSSICIFRDSLWAATDSGLVVAPLQVATLRLPSVWRRITAAEGLPFTGNRIVRTDGSAVYVVNGDTLLRRSSDTFVRVTSTSTPLLRLTFGGGQWFISTESGITSSSSNINVDWPGPLLGHMTYLRGDGSVEIVAFVRDVGIARTTPDGSVAPVAINSPLISQFMDVDIDRDGRLWAASYNDQSRTGQGVSVFDGLTWSSYTTTTTPELLTNNIYRINPLRDGRVILGSWGRGALEIDVDGVITRSFSNVNSQLTGIDADEAFVLVGDVDLDRSGTLWMTNEQAADRVLVSMNSDGVSRQYKHCIDPRNNYFRPMVIDGGGTKWLGGPGGNGLLAYHERSTPDDPSDDLCVGLRSSTTNLPDNIVNALAIDKNGAVWIGTAKGVAVISAPGAATNTTVPFVRRISALSAVQVNDVFVDALNYKWIATTSGVFVLNEDGTEVISTITTSSSPLLNDNVRSVCVDDRTGRAWFGMVEGLSSVVTQSQAPLTSFNVRCYPQPFRPTDGSQLVIDGLAADSDVRILTPGGIMINALQTRGRQALWDGRDVQGRLAPPGVYIVQVRSASSKDSGVGKVVVTR